MDTNVRDNDSEHCIPLKSNGEQLSFQTVYIPATLQQLNPKFSAFVQEVCSTKDIHLPDGLPTKKEKGMTPEEVFGILINFKKHDHWLTTSPPYQPPPGSVFLFNRKSLTTYRKDGYEWLKKKKASNATRLDRLTLKVFGKDLIHATYSKHEIEARFKRRVYWINENRSIVLVHYLLETRYEILPTLSDSVWKEMLENSSKSSETTSAQPLSGEVSVPSLVDLLKFDQLPGDSLVSALQANQVSNISLTSPTERKRKVVPIAPAPPAPSWNFSIIILKGGNALIIAIPPQDGGPIIPLGCLSLPGTGTSKPLDAGDMCQTLFGKGSSATTRSYSDSTRQQLTQMLLSRIDLVQQGSVPQSASKGKRKSTNAKLTKSCSNSQGSSSVEEGGLSDLPNLIHFLSNSKSVSPSPSSSQSQSATGDYDAKAFSSFAQHLSNTSMDPLNPVLKPKKFPSQCSGKVLRTRSTPTSLADVSSSKLQPASLPMPSVTLQTPSVTSFQTPSVTSLQAPSVTLQTPSVTSLQTPSVTSLQAPSVTLQTPSVTSLQTPSVTTQISENDYLSCVTDEPHGNHSSTSKVCSTSCSNENGCQCIGTAQPLPVSNTSSFSFLPMSTLPVSPFLASNLKNPTSQASRNLQFVGASISNLQSPKNGSISEMHSASLPTISSELPHAQVFASPTQPLSSSTQPLSSSTQPLSSSTQPLSSSTQPLSSSTQPLLSSTQPLLSSTQPLSSSTQPLSSSTQPLSSSTQPLSSSTQPLSSSTQPGPCSSHSDFSPSALFAVPLDVFPKSAEYLGTPNSHASIPNHTFPTSDTNMYSPSKDSCASLKNLNTSELLPGIPLFSSLDSLLDTIANDSQFFQLPDLKESNAVRTGDGPGRMDTEVANTDNPSSTSPPLHWSTASSGSQHQTYEHEIDVILDSLAQMDHTGLPNTCSNPQTGHEHLFDWSSSQPMASEELDVQFSNASYSNDQDAIQPIVAFPLSNEEEVPRVTPPPLGREYSSQVTPPPLGREYPSQVTPPSLGREYPSQVTPPPLGREYPSLEMLCSTSLTTLQDNVERTERIPPRLDLSMPPLAAPYCLDQQRSSLTTTMIPSTSVETSDSLEGRNSVLTPGPQGILSPVPGPSSSHLTPSYQIFRSYTPISPSESTISSHSASTLSLQDTQGILDSADPPIVQELCELLGESRSIQDRDFADMNLSDKEQQELLRAARTIQNAFRKLRQKRWAQKQKEAALIIEKSYSKYKEQKQKDHAARVIQQHYRAYRQSHIASHSGELVDAVDVMERLCRLKENEAARKIQRFIRQRKNRTLE